MTTNRSIPHDVARILDANGNRAREALRVMEEYVRFVLNDRAANEVLKQLRHDLASCLADFDHNALLSARNTPTDVGTTLTTEREASRHNAKDVFIAAAKRLPEALRALEEYSKTINPAAASRIESLRYRAYELEQRVLTRGDRSARMASARLYVIVTAELCKNDWLVSATQAITHGADVIQLREKDLEDNDLLERARQLSSLCKAHNTLFIINDRPDIALLCDADGLHLGQTDLAYHDARRVLGTDRLIGISTHDESQLAHAIAEAPDYIAAGPMYATTTKPQPHVPGPALLEAALTRTQIPVVCIGGITPDRAGQLAQLGRACVCVCSAVISQNRPDQATRAFRDIIDRSAILNESVS